MNPSTPEMLIRVRRDGKEPALVSLPHVVFIFQVTRMVLRLSEEKLVDLADVSLDLLQSMEKTQWTWDYTWGKGVFLEIPEMERWLQEAWAAHPYHEVASRVLRTIDWLPGLEISYKPTYQGKATHSINLVIRGTVLKPPIFIPSQVKDVARYTAYLQSPAWRSLRQRAFQRDGYRCRLCSSVESLIAHHRTYERVYQEWLSDLTTLCDRCHWSHHAGLRLLDGQTVHKRRLYR